MNDPMPPEISRSPEDDQVTPLGVQSSRQSGRPADRKHDELIAVFVALLGIGSILWFTLGRQNSPFGGLALQTAPAPTGVTANTGTIAPTLNASPSNSAVPAAGVAAGVATGAMSGNNPAGAAMPQVNRAPEAKVKTIVVEASPSPSPTSEVGGVVPAVPNASLNAPASPVTASPSAPVPIVAAPAGKDELPPAKAAKQFKDVPASAAIAPYVAVLSSRGLLDGFDDNTFLPDKPITRAEFAVILGKAFEKPRSKTAVGYKDVTATDANAKSIAEATQTGFMTGFPDGSFRPDVQIPRAQMQTAIVTGLGLGPNGDPVQALQTYSDLKDVPKWAVPKVAAAVAAGILPSKNATTLVPNQPATRGEAAVMIHEALVKEGKLPAIK
jgi:S-layer homology domain